MNEKKLYDMNIELENLNITSEFKLQIEPILESIKFDIPDYENLRLSLHYSLKDSQSHQTYNSQIAEKKNLPVCRFWKTPWYGLLLTHYNSIPTIKSLPKNAKIPSLIKHENMFFIYGLSEDATPQVKELKVDSDLLEQLNFFKFNICREIRVSSIDNDKIYNAIAEQKCHTQKLPELNELCVNSIGSNIIEKGEKYERENLPMEFNRYIDHKIEACENGIRNEELQKSLEKNNEEHREHFTNFLLSLNDTSWLRPK